MELEFKSLLKEIIDLIPTIIGLGISRFYETTLQRHSDFLSIKVQ